MAQTGFTPILLYSSSTAAAAPTAGNLTNSTLGSELAINIADGKLFYKDSGGSIQVIAWKTTPTSAGGTGLTSYTAGDLLYYATGTTLSKLGIGANKTILTSSGTAPQWSASLDTTQGGTGVTSYTAGDLLYFSTGTTLSKLAIGSNTQILTSTGSAPQWSNASSVSIGTATNLAGGAQGSIPYQSAASTTAFLAKDTNATRYLANSGTNNNPAWAQVSLTNGVTGTLPVANGGTNLTSFTANGVMYASSTSALATGSVLTFDGTTLSTTAFSAKTALGTTYAGTSTSGTTIQIIDTGIYYNTATIGFGDFAVYELYFSGNPSPGGSGYYRTGGWGTIVIGTSYDSTLSVKQQIFYTELQNPNFQDVGEFTITALFYNGTTEATQFSVGTNYQIRIKMDGFQAGYIGNSMTVRLIKRHAG